MIKSKRDLLKILGMNDEATDAPLKPVDPLAERAINGLERLIEELEKEEDVEKDAQASLITEATS